MPTRKLWAGAPGSRIDPPGDIPERDKKDHPDVWINGRHYAWEPGQEHTVPAEAVAVWRAYEEANQ